jgi:hypothetical protein
VAAWVGILVRVEGSPAWDELRALSAWARERSWLAQQAARRARLRIAELQERGLPSGLLEAADRVAEAEERRLLAEDRLAKLR